MICKICKSEKPVADYYLTNGRLMRKCKKCHIAIVQKGNAMQKENMLAKRAELAMFEFRTRLTRKEKNQNDQTSEKGSLG